MPTSNYYQNLIKQTAQKSVEATISILGITDKGLRRHLVQELDGNKNKLGLLTDPVFESMFPWEQIDTPMSSLSGNLLEPSLIDAMDNTSEHRFGKDWFPFKHQEISWRTLLKKPCKSLVVTSGTGSGKTECFMVPILNDLAQEYKKNQRPLEGVHALFIYPLNALINSQRERMRAWTAAYNDGLRFCLYNGNTKENKHKDQGKFPNEILTRKVLREKPAPLLVTNATMLEYMLVRQIDAPIIEKSYGKLKWIVLDEAHTYIGSQAAELSLLLRRVMHAFGVEAKNVRFVATSATIGDSEADEKLQTYLASLSGVSVDQVVVVGGKRSVPSLPELHDGNLSINEINRVDKGNQFSDARYKALASNPIAVRLRTTLADSGVPSTLSNLTNHLFNDASKQEETLAWIDACSSTSKPGPNKKNLSQNAEAFLPVRGHLFHQVLSGLWCCADKNCSAKKDTALAGSWPFGFVYSQRRNNCTCGAPIFELLFCNDCNAPHLMSMESGGYLIQKDREAVDEFSLDYESSEENELDLEAPDSTDQVILAPKGHEKLTYPVSIDPERLLSPPGVETINLNAIDPGDIACAVCEYSGFKKLFYRRSLLGTPFYISNNIPNLLDACQESEEASDRPNRGKRLITFTDSRQGTARISTKIQQDSERDSLRGLIYGAAAHNIINIDEGALKEKRKKITYYEEKAEKLREIGEKELAVDVDEMACRLIQELDSIGAINTLKWNEAVYKLHASPDVSRWMFDYYKDLNPELFPDAGGARILTEMLLLREFSRRPKRLNSLETLGLVSVQYPLLKQIERAPEGWEKLGLSLDDWIDFLKVTLDFYIRENSIIDIPAEWVDWMGAKIYPKSVLKPGSTENTSSRIRRWPQVVKGRNSRLVRMLSIACDLDLKDPLDKDRINGFLNDAWKVLTKTYHVSNEQLNQPEARQIIRGLPASVQFHLAREEMAFQVCTQAWICPFTHRLLDTTFKGITPYLPFSANKDEIMCRQVDMAVCQIEASNFNSDLERKLAVREWVSQQPEITKLRGENLWTDISDSVVEGGKFFRTAEHSAQQPASILEKYEAMFKSGKLNVLSCSTTMEMGVDIGGISMVAMNNVPPHPANYLQRSGRAGRRGETQALSFTICKDNPHERSVFANPLWPFTTSIAAPYITLNSERIVQRHINSLLLSYFLKEVLEVTETAITSLNCQWFFSNEDIKQAPVDTMLRWLESFKFEQMPGFLNSGVKKIIKGSILASVPIERIISRSIDSLTGARDRWLPGYEKLKFEFSKVESLGKTNPFRRKVAYDLKCMGEDYLLSELASRAFLPGYGFPTGIATFDHYSISDYKRGKYVNTSGRIDNQTRMRERPGRDMSLAIREYAPGADIVINGLVYRSGGILLNKYSPNEDYSQPQKMVVEWRCHRCGFIGSDSGATFDDRCSDCGTRLKQEHIKEYIEPTGFAVEFYSSPSTDISSQSFIPAQEPWVTASADLNTLFEPKLGAYRSSAQGHIFHHTSGVEDTGFAVCLRCGKAESMTGDGDYPVGVQPGKPHIKLQGKIGPEANAWCEGPDEAYAIKGGVHLGATDQTDVFELYLTHPKESFYIQHRKKDPLPWTLAVVLRQALADIHGINADEMGYTVNPSTLPGCDYPVAGIILYDKSGGGAGFSSAAPLHLRDMFFKALGHLNCVEQCDSACQSCLMGYDTRYHIDLLNRHVAIEYIQEILPYFEVAPEAKLFGETSRYCMESISAEILAGATQGIDTLRIFTGGPYGDWDVSISGLKDSCLSWRHTFKRVELVLPSVDLGTLSDIHKEDLFALRNLGINISVVADSDINLLDGGSLLAQTVSDKRAISYASNALGANIPSIDWWDLESYYLVKSNQDVDIQITEIDHELLSIDKAHGDVEVELTIECDGPITKFGEKLWDELFEKSTELKNAINDANILKSIAYSDCYISSPWALILFAEVIDSLKFILGENWSNPSLKLVTGDKEPSGRAKGLYAEWSSREKKHEVITEYFRQMDEEIDVDILPLREMSHGRILSLSWGDGSVSHVRFDHGVGCWSLERRPHTWLDIEGESANQVMTMFGMLKEIGVRYNKKFPTQIFVKKR